MAIDETIRKRRIIVTCGTGGVGKTTLSSAIALRAAAQGKNAVVITIDPAKRLATSLGISHLGDHPTDLTDLARDSFAKARKNGLNTLPAEFKGRFSAIIPDTRRTFELFVRDLAPNSSVADRVMKNPIFEIFAKDFSGANEYMALERLYALDRERKFDLIVLDTPPSRNTLAFLNAPKLLAQLFEERLIKWLVMPANRIVSMGMRKAIGLLERLTGAGFMSNLVDFASALFEVQTGFTRNLKTITDVLESESVGFLMVASPSPETAPEALHFVETLKKHRFHFDGVALNRTLSYLPNDSANEADEPAFQLIKKLQAREETVLKQLSQNNVELRAKLPELARDVHSIEDLFHVAMAF